MMPYGTGTTKFGLTKEEDKRSVLMEIENHVGNVFSCNMTDKEGKYIATEPLMLKHMVFSLLVKETRKVKGE